MSGDQPTAVPDEFSSRAPTRGLAFVAMLLIVMLGLPAAPAEALALTGVSVVYDFEAGSPTGTRTTITFTAATSSGAVTSLQFEVPPGSLLASNATFTVTPDGGSVFDETTTGAGISLAGTTVTIDHPGFTLDTGGSSTIVVDGLLITSSAAWGTTTALQLTSTAGGPLDGPTDAADETIAAAATSTASKVKGAASDDEINAATAASVTVQADSTGTYATSDDVVAVLLGPSSAAVSGSVTVGGTPSTIDVTGIDVSALPDGSYTLFTFVDDGTDVSAAVSGAAVMKDATPTALGVNGALLQYDIDGDGQWASVDDVLSIAWTEPTTLAASLSDGGGIDSTEETELEAILGTDVAIPGGTLITVTGDGSPQWSLRITGSDLTEGIALDDSLMGTTNTNVLDGFGNGQAVASGPSTLFGGEFLECGANVAGVTVNDQCVETFETSGDGGTSWDALDPDDGTGLDVSTFNTGLLQVQVIDTAAAGANGEQYELIGGDAHLLSASDLVKIGLRVGTTDPTVLIGTAELDSYTVTVGAPNTVELIGSPRAASFTWDILCVVGSCGGDSTAATVDYVGTLTYALDPLTVASPADRAALDGLWIMTDAQSFGTPAWNAANGTFDLEVAAPHLMQSGPLNEGFFKAFIPAAMFGPDYFDVDPASATYSATAAGSGVTVDSTVVLDGATVTGVRLEVTGFHYSSPEISISAGAPQTVPAPAPAPPAPASPAFDTPIEKDLGVGGQVTTDPTGEGATVERPTQTSITTPVAGKVAVAQKQTTTTELPSGQTKLDIEVDITAPDATPEEPLILGFELDASLLEGVDLDRLTVYRNGQAVTRCADAVAAVPDPCLALSEAQEDGDLVLRVRTSQASIWNFATVDAACPAGLVASGGFTDVADASPHADNIDCVAWWDLVKGTHPERFTPSEDVTRGQVATVLVGLFETLGTDLPAAGDRFSDDHPDHGEAAEILAALGLVQGTSDGRFEAGRSVTRAQLATLLVGVFEALSGEPIGAGDGAPFSDVADGVHAEGIAGAIAADLARGTTATSYDPSRVVTRAQLASFVANLLERLVADGLADPPL